MAAFPIDPVIATAQEVYDYCNISSAQASANLPNGSTTVAALIARLLIRSAAEIVSVINHDYTLNQVITFKWIGDGSQIVTTRNPIQAVSSLISWDATQPTTAPLVLSPGIVTINPILPQVAVRNDGNGWEAGLFYYMQFTQAANPDAPAGWPNAIKEIQIEWVSKMYKDTWNLAGSLDWGQQPEHPNIKLLDMNAQWRNRLRPFKFYEV